ncbi:MAG: hypothetical protein U1G07_10215 [Verrucomicrobiota bacterium]
MVLRQSESAEGRLRHYRPGVTIRSARHAEALRACLDKSADRYAKPIAIVETAFPWSNSINVVGLPATPQGQADFVVALTKILLKRSRKSAPWYFWVGVEYQAIECAHGGI